MYGLAISFAYFVVSFLKISTVKKKIPTMGSSSTLTGGVLAPDIQKIIYYLTIASINVLNFKTFDLKYIVLGTIANNFVLYHCVKEIVNFITTWQPLEFYTANYIHHQFMLRCN